MLANGLSDPYTRFITGEQFQAMQSYDITGVGLNICTAAELEEKTDFRAPEVHWLSMPIMMERRRCCMPIIIWHW